MLVNLAEYVGHFNPLIRTIIFYLYIALNLLVLIRYVFIPGFKLLKIGKIISHDEAAAIIGKHFADVSDKLLNTLQLQRLREKNSIKTDLLSASIDQKIKELKPIPFQSAIDLGINRKYLKYPLVPVIFLVAILFIAPGMITEPTDRLVHHGKEFVRPLPFQIIIQNEDLQVVQHDDFMLSVRLEGEEIPEGIMLKSGRTQAKLKKENAVRFQYHFKNVQDNIRFRLMAGDVITDEFELTVLPKPLILDFDVELDYPAYTQKKDEKIRNNGDLLIPTGTKVRWQFSTKNTEAVYMNFGDEPLLIPSSSPLTFFFEKEFFTNVSYSINTSNQYLKNKDSLAYEISVIPDFYPVIGVEEMRDSILNKHLYFKGFVKDDYGFRLLTFNLYNEKGKMIVKDTLALASNLNPQQFFHFTDLGEQDIVPGQKLSYYFEVWDNDQVNGTKSSKSQVMMFELPSLEEVENQKEESNEQIKDEMESAMDDLRELQKEVDEMNRKLVDKKELTWEDREQVKQLLEKQKEIQSKLEEIKKENEVKSLKEQQYKEVNEEILEKQKKLEELFKDLMENEELKKLFEELQELMEETNKDKMKEMLEEMKMSNEELEKMLDRNLELFKQLEFEQKLDETIDKLENLAEDQDQLSEESLDKENAMEDIKSRQEELKSDFEKLEKDLEKLDELNKELESPNEFDPMEEQQEQVEEQMEESMEQMDDNKRKKASESQKKASEQMEEMAQSLTQMQQDMIQQGMAEDIDALRDILENLIQLSFDQEALIDKVNDTKLNDPRYTSLVQEQNKIKDDLEMVEDSLVALSKRQIMIEPFVTKEISAINQNIEKTVTFLNNRQPQQATGRMQFIMTSVNNLALMLSESLNQMMSAMSMSNSSCKNPGQSKPKQGQNSVKSMRQLQEQLNKQIEQLRGQQQEGKDKQGKKGLGESSMSEQLARTAAQQEYIRNEMRKLAEQLDKEGQFGAGKELKRIAEDMEKTETDLVNKMLTEETLMRQRQILTRLLQSEKAELEREKEEKRESAEGKNVFLRNPEELFKYKKVQNSEVELLQPVPASLTPFYKNKVNQYFFNFEELLEQ
jgi:hypothetical protein